MTCLTRACSGRRCAPPLNRRVVSQRSNVLGTIEEQVAELVELLHGRGDESAVALCNLTSLGVGAIPLVAAAYDRERRSKRRVAILHALWEFRDPAALPTLAAALRDSDECVWKEALDG